MELAGLKRGLKFLLEDKQMKIESLTTDRHISVKCYMGKDHPDIDHRFDVWHVAKG